MSIYYIIQNERVGPWRHAVSFAEGTFRDIKTQLQKPYYKPRGQDESNCGEYNQSNRRERLEVVATALYNSLIQNENGSIGFPLRRVCEGIKSGYKKRNLRKKVTKAVAKSNIRILVGSVKIFENNNGQQVPLRLMVAYDKKPNSPEYGYILPSNKR